MEKLGQYSLKGVKTHEELLQIKLYSIGWKHKQTFQGQVWVSTYSYVSGAAVFPAPCCTLRSLPVSEFHSPPTRKSVWQLLLRQQHKKGPRKQGCEPLGLWAGARGNTQWQRDKRTHGQQQQHGRKLFTGASWPLTPQRSNQIRTGCSQFSTITDGNTLSLE